MGGAYTRRLIHSKPVRSADGGGGHVRSWAVQGAHWATVRMRSGTLKETEFGRTPRLAVRMTIRAVPQDHAARPWPGDRLADGLRSFAVEAVQESPGRRLTILAREVPREEGRP